MFRAFLVLLFACLAYIHAMTTMSPDSTTKHGHHSNTTREPSEHESFRFSYDPHTRMIVVTNSNTCYIFTLTDDEAVAVHSDTGIRALELKLLSLLTSETKTAVTKDQLDSHIAHACGGRITEYYNVV